MANTITINVLGNTKQFNSALKGVQNDLGRLGTASQKAGNFLKGSLKVAGVGAVAAGVAIGKFAKDSISAASDLNETISKTKTIFGDASPDLMKFGNAAAKSIGMSKNEALTGLSTFGNFFDQIGIGTQKSAEMSKQFVKMSADLGSFHNAAPVEVMDALAAATRGEYDSLQKFIPTLNAAAVEQKAMSMTGKESAKTLTQQEKATAMYQLALKGQGAAQGDFARTSSSLANQQKILAAQFENVKTKIGTALMPVVQQLMGYILKEGVPALKQFADWFKAEGPGAIQSAVGAFKTFLGVVKPIAAFVAENAGTILKLVAAFYAIVAVVAAVNFAMSAYAVILSVVKVAIIVFRNAQLALNLAMMLNPVGLVIAAIVALVAIFVIAYKKSETFRNIIDASWNAIKKATSAVFGWMKDFIKGAFDFLKNLFMNFTGPGLIIKHWDKIKSATSAAWNAVKNAVKAVWDWLKSAVSTVFNAVKNGVTNAWDAIKSKTTAAWNAVKNAVQNAWDGIKNAVQTSVAKVISIVQALPGKIKGFFAGAAGWLLSAGRNIIQGLLDGISGMIGSVKNKLGELTNMIPNWKGPAAKDKKLLRPVGKMIMQGLVKGFDDGRDGIQKNLGQITDLIAKTMDKRFKSDKDAAAASKRVIQSLQNEVKAAMENAKARENMAERIEKAQERLNEVRQKAAEYAASISSGVVDFGSIGNLGKDAETGAVTIGGILGDLKTKVTDAKTYKGILDTLIKMGLNKTTLDQLAQMGVEGGLATAQAIASGGKEAIGQINTLTKELAATGKAMGKTLSTEMFGAGVEAAQGMLKGLKSKERELIEQAKDLARALTRAVKKELGIKSPSRVFQRLGENTVKGMEIGLKDTNGVERAMVRLSDAMVNGFERPSLTASASGGTGGNVNVTVNVPPTANPAATGKEIQRVLDEYYRTGGIRRA